MSTHPGAINSMSRQTTSHQVPLMPRDDINETTIPTAENRLPCSSFSGCGLEQQVSPSGFMTANANFQTTMGSHLESQYMSLFEYPGSEAMSMLQDPVSIIPGSMNHDYPYDLRLFDGTPPFGSSVTETDQHRVMLSPPVVWDHGPSPGSSIAAGYFDPQSTKVGSMPLAPGAANFEPMPKTFANYQGPWEESEPTSPSQTSSVAGSWSSSAFVDFSTRQSSASCFSPSTMSNIFRVAGNTEPVSVPVPVPIRVPAVSAAAATAATRMLEDVTKKSRRSMSSAPRGKRKDKSATSIAGSHTFSPYPTPSPKNDSTIAQGAVHKTSPVFFEGSASPSKHQGTLMTAFLPPTDHHFLNHPPKLPDSQRQRNRQAATKCRAKTRAAVADLESMDRAVTAANMELTETVKDLRNQVLTLKHELLRHGDCSCDVIRQYLKNAAREIGAGQSKPVALSTPAELDRRGSVP